jgi:hypothetical protein
LGHQKQRLPGIGREVFGLGDAIANPQKTDLHMGRFGKLNVRIKTRPELAEGNIKNQNLSVPYFWIRVT